MTLEQRRGEVTTLDLNSNMASMSLLEYHIGQWHINRNLIAGSSDIKQFDKLLEEVEELRLSLDGDLTPIDDLGDIMVVLINIAHRNNLTLHDCMAHAYDEIKERKGQMVNGLFVKERSKA